MRGQQRRRRWRRRGNFISRRDAHRPLQRNYLLRLAAGRPSTPGPVGRSASRAGGPAWPTSVRWRPPANSSRPARCASGQTALSVSQPRGDRRAVRFRPVLRRIVKFRLHLPCCQCQAATTAAVTYVAQIDTHPSLCQGVAESKFSSFYRTFAKPSHAVAAWQ